MLATALKGLMLLGIVFLFPLLKKTCKKTFKDMNFNADWLFILPCFLIWLIVPDAFFYGSGLGVFTAGLMVAWAVQTSYLTPVRKALTAGGICFIATFFLPHEVGFFYRLLITLMWAGIVGLFLLLYHIPKLLPFMIGGLFLTFMLFQSFPKFYEVFPIGGIGWLFLVTLCAFVPLLTKQTLSPTGAGFLGFCYGYALMVFAAHHWTFFVFGAISYALVEVVAACGMTFMATKRFYPWTVLSMTERLFERDTKPNRRLFYNLVLLTFVALMCQYVQVTVFYWLFALVLVSVLFSLSTQKTRRPSYKEVLMDTKAGLKVLWQDVKGQIAQLKTEKVQKSPKRNTRKKK